MSTFLPLFPLRLVAYPGEDLNLHIFEPRYKQLIRECEEKNITFGLPAFINNKISAVGTELKLVKIEKNYPKGEMDIRTKGIGIFRIKDFFKDVEHKLYSGAEVERIDLNMEGDFIKYENIFQQLGELYQVLDIRRALPELDGNFNTYKIAHHVGFNIEQEYEFLCIPDEKRRQNYMLQHLQRLIPTAREMEALRKKVQMNGHFKNMLPPPV